MYYSTNVSGPLPRSMTTIWLLPSSTEEVGYVEDIEDMEDGMQRRMCAAVRPGRQASVGKSMSRGAPAVNLMSSRISPFALVDRGTPRALIQALATCFGRRRPSSSRAGLRPKFLLQVPVLMYGSDEEENTRARRRPSPALADSLEVRERSKHFEVGDEGISPRLIMRL